jgi:hypothetical protein
MKKASVALSDEDMLKLKLVAQMEGRSLAEIIREALRLYASRVDTPPREFLMEGVAEGPGDSIFDLSEEEVMAGFGE